jgi:hypothetical protein
MKPNPILEEIWRIKDDLAREADYDIHKLCENTRKWAASHPHSGPVISNPAELRELVHRREADAESSAAFHDAPTPDPNQ